MGGWEIAHPIFVSKVVAESLPEKNGLRIGDQVRVTVGVCVRVGDQVRVRVGVCVRVGDQVRVTVGVCVRVGDQVCVTVGVCVREDAWNQILCERC